jgi:succinyl-diaminopimelate desuccinylase
MNSVTDYIESHRQAFEDDLKALLRIPSVSADSRQRGETRRAAEWVASQFSGLSLATELVETAGHPIVYAESPPVLGKPIALVYGHYDVQPPEPLDEWITPPFEPTQRDGNLYARGATDDKGQMLTHVKSVEAWIKTVGKLPIQVKFLIEGEEEVGSEHLGPFVKANRNRSLSAIAPNSLPASRPSLMASAVSPTSN